MLKPEAKKRYEAFWQSDAYERACLYLTAPSGVPNSGEKIEDVTRHWEDLDARWDGCMRGMASSKLYADAFYSVFTNFGPGCLTACVGGSFRWAKDTVWFENEQVIEDWTNPPEPRLNMNSRMAGLVDGYTDILLDRADGRYITSLTDIGGTFDIIAALRGTQELLVDLFDYPDEIQAYVKRFQPVWQSYFHAQTARLLKAQGAVSSWMPIYSEKSYYPLQCDFCAMISPDMFGEFVLPNLRYQTEGMERAIYHLDGPGELPHVDQLLSLERLNAIQWTSGSGAPEIADPCWFELYHRIQRAGKGIVLLGVNPDKLERLLENISTRGLYLSVSAKDDAQAREIERMVNLAGVR